MSTKELITFQFGHFANFVGSHWWNLQEATFAYCPSEVKYPKEINHDVLFREGKNLSGEVTYTPRLISFDLKGSLNTLRQDGILYELQGIEEDILWRNDVTLHKLDVNVRKNEFLRDLETTDPDEEKQIDLKYAPSKDIDESDVASTSKSQSEIEPLFGKKYYDLDESVVVWSDFLKPHLHPKSVHVVEQYRHDEGSFDIYGYGEEVMKDLPTRSGIEDRVHFFLEECDNLQGMQMLVDTYNGFGGLSAEVLQEICDDYSNKSVLIYSVTPTSFPNPTIASECCRVVNTLLSLEKLLSHSDAIVPLSMASTLWRAPGTPRQIPFINYKPELSYHSSALLAAAIDSMSLPLRLEHNSTLLPHLTSSMATHGRKMLALQSCFPLALREKQYLADYLYELEDKPLWHCLTPYCSAKAKPHAQSVVVQGIAPQRVQGSPDPRKPTGRTFYKNLDSLMERYLSDVYSTPLNAICDVRRPCTVTSPFPHIFDPRISIEGHQVDKNRPPKTGVEEVAMMTSLQSTNEMTQYITALLKEVSKYNISKFHKFLDNGLEVDSFKEAIENMKTFNKCYSCGYESDDSDDDVDLEET